MAYCQQCGKPMATGNIFCESCGAKNEPASTLAGSAPEPIIAPVPPPPPPPPPRRVEPIATPPPPPVTYSAPPAVSNEPRYTQPETKPQGTGKGLFISIAALLGVVVLAMAIFAFMQTGKLNDARINVANLEQDVSNLEANVSTLEGQLTTEKANVASITGQLADEKTRSAGIQTELTNTKGTLATAQGNLTTAQGRITTLEADLSTSKANATKLQTDLDTANAKVTSIQAELTKAAADLTKANADLAKANTDLVAAKATNTSLTGDLNKIKDPRHFNTLQELTDWLAKDDTNTNPAYAALRGAEKAYILQVKALRDGFLLPASLDWDSQYIYYGNLAIAGNMLVGVDPTTDTIYQGPNYNIPSHPLPLT